MTDARETVREDLRRLLDGAGRGRAPHTPPGDVPDDRTPASSGEEVGRALSFLLRSAGARPQSEAELAAKLRRRGFDGDVAREAMAQAKAAGAVDDAAFARAWVADRGCQRGFGAARLRQELQRRQVPDHIAAAALAALDERDDLAVATELARERASQLRSSLKPEAVARRLQSYLVRRGHPPALAQRVAIDVSGLARDWD